jgi:dipeptidyl aminopeptidase/acylaminoacyl peptidase
MSHSGMLLRTAMIAAAAMTCADVQALDTRARQWTAETSVAIAYYSRDMDDPWSWLGQNPIQHSPDGRFVFFVRHHGDLLTDSNVYVLQVYSISSVREAIASDTEVLPLVEITRSSSSTSQSEIEAAIDDARWNPQSTAIYFLGLDPNGVRQVHRLDIESNEASQQTSLPLGVHSFEFLGNTPIVHARAQRMIPEVAYPTEPVIRGRRGMVVPPSSRANELRPTVLLAPSGQVVPVSLPCECRLILGEISPDQQSATVDLRNGPSLQNAILDLRTGSIRILLAPGREVSRTDRIRASGWRYDLGGSAWSDDGSTVVLINKAPPGTSDGGYVIASDVESGRWQILTPVFSTRSGRQRLVQSVRFTGEAEIEVTHLIGELLRQTTTFSRTGNRWVQRRVQAGGIVSTQSAQDITLDSASTEDGLHISLREGLNEPTQVVASLGEQEIVLSRPDPALSGVNRESWTPITWTGPDGAPMNGALLLPPGTRADRHPPPLVIQQYYFFPDLFLPDGAQPTSDAAQALAARGFAVLQFESTDHDNVADEGAYFVRRLDSAIDALADRGLIDRNRVGLTGFSRSGYLAYYAITHPGRNPLAAVMASDFFSGGFPAYLSDAAETGTPNEYDVINGQSVEAGRFWQNPNGWLENDPTFNIHRVQTPALFTWNGNAYSEKSRQIIGAFLLNRRPLEALYFPRGMHTLLWPRERVAAIEATVDWMAFWILGEEDSRPEKEEQYLRWRRLRHDWINQRQWEAQGNRVGSSPDGECSPRLTTLEELVRCRGR